MAADGIVASLNAGPVMEANPGIGEATLLPEASVASRAAAVALQPPVMTDVPNEEAADGLAPGGSCGDSIPVDPTALLASSVVLGIAAPMPVVEHVVIVPMGLPEFGPKTPRLNCIAPSGVAAVPAISGIALRVLIGNVIFIADALRGAVDPTCAKLELALNNTTVAIPEIKLRIDTSCVSTKTVIAERSGLQLLSAAPCCRRRA